MNALTARGSVLVRVADVPLAAKLDALGAGVAFVREAHRDVMSVECWRELNLAQEALARAMMNANKFTAPEGLTMHRIGKPVIIETTTAAGEVVTPAAIGAAMP